MTDADEPPRGFSRPSRLKLLREFALPLDAMKFILHSPMLVGAPRGDGRPVMLLPGYQASEMSMIPLQRFLEHLGYDISHWGLGRNLGAVDQYTGLLTAELAEHKASNGVATTLIGWSLGGSISRRLARETPELVREVITMGTPIIGGPKYTNARMRATMDPSQDLDELEKRIHKRNLQPITQPLTVIYSEIDGIVGSDIAIDTYNAHARNIKVNSSHLAMGASPKIWRIIADTLADSAV